MLHKKLEYSVVCAFVCASLSMMAVACESDGSLPEPDSVAPIIDPKADSPYSEPDPEAIEPAALPRTGPLPASAELDSREYKVMLEPARFSNEPTDALRALEVELLAAYSTEAADIASGDLGNLRKNREVRFFDTRGTCLFRQNGFAFRERVEDGEREVTVKFRAPDRYIAASHDLSSSRDGAESKFEEDIKPGYRSVFSRSTTSPIGDGKNLNKLEDLTDISPNAAWSEFDKDQAMEVVGALNIREAVYGKKVLDLGEMDAEISVTLWYLEGDTPAVAELSFSYEAPEREFDARSVARGMALFEAMQSLDGWVSSEAMTKTAWVYANAGGFCE